MPEERVAIVSGAAQGLGAGFTRALSAQGVRVLAFDRQDAVEAMAAEVQADTGVQVLPMVADAAQRADCERVVQTAVDTFGGVDILVNNAGTWRRTPVDSSFEQAVEDWHYIMDTNLLGVLMLSRLCVPLMRARGGGDIVNISTYYVLPARGDGTNQPETDLYNASKWALNGFTDAWSKALADDHIRVNGLCMGAVDTPMLRGFFPGGKLPEDLGASVMQPAQLGQLLIDLLNDGRSGENIGAWVGEPVVLPEPAAAHRRISG